MKSNQQGKGKANDVSGIPLPGAIPQVEGQSVEPNRDEPQGAFKTESTDNYAHDYFDDEEDRLGNLQAPYTANKADQEWSDGIKDEENEDDARDDEGLFPETQPLHVDPMTETGADDNADVMLRPTQVDDDAA
jgi:hypothetical protein